MYTASVYLRALNDESQGLIDTIEHQNLQTMLDIVTHKYPEMKHKGRNVYGYKRCNDITDEIEVITIYLVNRRVIVTPIETINLNGWIATEL